DPLDRFGDAADLLHRRDAFGAPEGRAVRRAPLSAGRPRGHGRRRVRPLRAALPAGARPGGWGMSWGATGLVVRFGSTAALAGVDLTIEPGRIHAVIGGDGSGKTTLLRALAGAIPVDGGSVRRPGPGRIGYVSIGGGLFPDLTVDENLDFVARVLSGGQQRKLAGILALLPEPELLVLDEVTTGVDPRSRMEIWRLVMVAAAAGSAVVVATAYLDEAERAGHVVLLHEGRVLAFGSPQSIVDAVTGTVEDVATPADPDLAWRRGAQWRQWRPAGSPAAGGRLRLEDAAIISELLAERVPRP